MSLTHKLGSWADLFYVDFNHFSSQNLGFTFARVINTPGRHRRHPLYRDKGDWSTTNRKEQRFSQIKGHIDQNISKYRRNQTTFQLLEATTNMPKGQWSNQSKLSLKPRRNMGSGTNMPESRWSDQWVIKQTQLKGPYKSSFLRKCHSTIHQVCRLMCSNNILRFPHNDLMDLIIVSNEWKLLKRSPIIGLLLQSTLNFVVLF